MLFLEKTLCCPVQVCPTAWTAIITNPVNSTVPIAAEIFKSAGCFNPNTLFGVTTLDVIRARTFIGKILSLDPAVVCDLSNKKSMALLYFGN
jgi:malate dehydrogenase